MDNFQDYFFTQCDPYVGKHTMFVLDEVITAVLTDTLVLANQVGKVTVGYQSIEKFMDNEIAGLHKNQKKMETQNHFKNTNRFVFLTKDAGLGVQKDMIKMYKKYFPNMALFQLPVCSYELPALLHFKSNSIKVFVVHHKNFTTNMGNLMLPLLDRIHHHNI
jgi:hypothetical protein